MRVLSLDGGGYLGLASAEFLRCCEERWGTKCADRFELFCGTSTGAIIALALAAGKSAEEVVEFYKEMGPDVFQNQPGLLGRHFPILRTVSAFLRPLHDGGPLVEALRGVFGDLTLGDLLDRGKKVVVPAFSITSGRPIVFKTDHALELRAHGGLLVRDVALASSAAPMYLPLAKMRVTANGANELLADGGLVANSPSFLGYVEALTYLRSSPEQVSLLSVGTPRKDLRDPASRHGKNGPSPRRGLYGWGFGKRVIETTIDAGGMVVDSALRRLMERDKAYYHRVNLSHADGLDLDVVSASATETLVQLGDSVMRDAPMLAACEPFFAPGEV